MQQNLKIKYILLAGTFNNIDLLIREIYIENDLFIFKSNHEIPQLSKVEGILDSIKNRFIISDSIIQE